MRAPAAPDLEQVLGTVTDVVYQNDAEGRVVWMSPSVLEVLGEQPGDLIGINMLDRVHPDDLANAAEARRGALAGEFRELVVRFRTSSGQYREVLARTRPLVSDGRVVGHLVTFRDEHEARASGRALTTVLAGNEVLVRATSEAELLEDMCAAIVVGGGYVFAWYGIAVDDDDCSVRAAAVAGDDQGYVESVTVTWDESAASGQGPTGQAIRTGATQVRNDLAADPHYRPWLEAATGRGVRCSISLPVTVDGRVHGALMVYAADADTFSPLARRMLERLAADLGYGLQRLVDVERRILAEQRFRLIAENALDVVVRTDVENGITWASPSLLEVLGLTPDDVIGSSARDWIHPDDLATVQQAQILAIDSGTDSAVSEARIRDQRGTWRWMRVMGRVLRDPRGTPTGEILTLRDTDAEVTIRMRAAFDTLHDPLTGLLNRAGFRSLLDEALTTETAKVAVLTVGIDNLASINDAFTHTAGDRVLIDVAERLVATVGPRDRVGRSADNQFSILVTYDEPAVLSDLAARLRDDSSCMVALGSQEIRVTVSVGVALSEGRQTSELLRDASTALHQARDRGGNRWEFLDPEISSAARDRLILQTGLREALTTTAIQAWFQPIVTLADAELCGYEALVRWVTQDGTVVPPDQFLPVAEQSDLIVMLDHKVLAQSLDLLAQIPSPLHVAVNVSGATLADPGMLDAVRSELARTRVDPTRLHLEVTETSLVSVTPEILHVMRDVAEQGITWWVDDFGTGYSSIAHLRDMPVGGLKLDRSFTSGVTTTASTDQRLAQALLGLANGLGLRTVAEGVETQEQADHLVAQGWELGQGWLFGRPAPH